MLADTLLSDPEVRKAWDEAMLAVLTPAPSLNERFHALDHELSAIESSIRTAMRCYGAPPNLGAMRRIVCLRSVLDLVGFLHDHSTDPVLSKRIRELKKAEERG